MTNTHANRQDPFPRGRMIRLEEYGSGYFIQVTRELNSSWMSLLQLSSQQKQELVRIFREEADRIEAITQRESEMKRLAEEQECDLREVERSRGYAWMPEASEKELDAMAERWEYEHHGYGI